MSLTITQNLLFGDSSTITVVRCNDDAVEKWHIQDLLDTSSRVLGISATYGKNCDVTSIAFSTLSRAFVVNMSTSRAPQYKQELDSKQRRIAKSRNLIQDHLLLNRGFHKYAFRMDKLAVALYLDLQIRISDAVDMLSLVTDGRHSLQALMNVMGGEEEAKLRKENVKSLFFGTSESASAIDAATKVALKAWAACRAATLPHMSPRFESLPRINTMTFPKEHMLAMANISRHADRLEALKPITVRNDVRDQFTAKKDAINLECDRFSTRIRTSTNQVIRIEIEGKESKTEVTGRARNVQGRNARISVNEPIRGDKIISVTTVGKGDPTFAETSRETVVLEALQRRSNILTNPFFQVLWLPKERPEWPKFKHQRGQLPVHFSRPLNASQHVAVEKILSDNDKDRVVVIHGPPGTGKTTVIAASVMSYNHANSSRSIWVAAQSNVAVKNIAEKFINEGFYQFKLLVSWDFHFDWHEHLYEKLVPCLIRSDSFSMSVVEASRMLLDCKVILCTLSMFSNPNIDVFLRIAPVEMIILDEASQIECGDYLPIFSGFHSTLAKLVLIGDDKQLPPYGQDDIPELRSVFEFPHLRGQALFLNTQYRMPHAIGIFISQNVYSGKLLTKHALTASKACLFIDVNKGQEDKKGHSWTNYEEVRVVVKLAQLYRSKNMAFRIITPYDAQRSLIENHLKAIKSDESLWENRVFNVDSFQGNEDDHIIVSVVRSQKPGFLKNQRRTNVMLTRCKKSMVICSSRSFLFDEASDTLVGKLAASLGGANWINGNDVVRGSRLFR